MSNLTRAGTILRVTLQRVDRLLLRYYCVIMRVKIWKKRCECIDVQLGAVMVIYTIDGYASMLMTIHTF